MLAATRALLTLPDPLPFRKRVDGLAEWARTAPDRAQVCAEVREQDPDKRHLAPLRLRRQATAAGAEPPGRLAAYRRRRFS